MVVGLAACAPPDSGDDPSPSETVDPSAEATREACESAQDQMFDIAIELDSMGRRMTRAVTYLDMGRMARSGQWDTRLAELQDELTGLNADTSAGLRFAKHLLGQGALGGTSGGAGSAVAEAAHLRAAGGNEICA
jgi:hypothetical protein